MHKVRLIPVLCFSAAALSLLLFSCTGNKNHRQPGKKDLATQEMINRSIAAFDEGDYERSQLILDSVAARITPASDSLLQLRFLLNKSELLKERGELNECLDNYFSAASMAYSLQDTSLLALAYYNIASVHYKMGHLEKCLEYCDKSAEIYALLDQPVRLANIRQIQAICFRKTGRYRESLDYLEKAREIYEARDDRRNTGICFNNMGNVYIYLHQPEEAYALYTKALAIARELNDGYGMASRYGNLAQALLDMGEPEKARACLDSSMVWCRKLSDKESTLTNYELYSIYYHRKGDLKTALAMKDSQMVLKAELMQVASEDYAQSTEKSHRQSLDLANTRSEMHLLKKDRERNRIVLGFIFSLALLASGAGAAIYVIQRQLRRKERQLHEEQTRGLTARNELQALRLKEQEAEEKRLRDELEFKRQELLKFSLSLSDRENLFDEISAKLTALHLTDDEQRQLVNTIRNQLKAVNQNEQLELFRQIEEVNSSFFFHLKNNYPQLTPDDIRLAALIMLDFSSKQIAELLTIEAKSVEMKRYRLRKKLQLDGGDDLKTFLQKIPNTSKPEN